MNPIGARHEQLLDEWNALITDGDMCTFLFALAAEEATQTLRKTGDKTQPQVREYLEAVRDGNKELGLGFLSCLCATEGELFVRYKDTDGYVRDVVLDTIGDFPASKIQKILTDNGLMETTEALLGADQPSLIANAVWRDDGKLQSVLTPLAREVKGFIAYSSPQINFDEIRESQRNALIHNLRRLLGIAKPS